MGLALIALLGTAYLSVHSLANSSCDALFFFNRVAIGPTKGSSGLGSASNEEIDKRTLDIVKAGDQLSFNISKQISPESLILQW